MNIIQKDAPLLEEVLACKGYPKVTFKDGRLNTEELISVRGAITTMERLDNFEESIAHLYEDGSIRRHHMSFGIFEDLIIEMPDNSKNGGYHQ